MARRLRTWSLLVKYSARVRNENADGDHDRAHDHAHAPATFGRAFAIGIALQTTFIVAEVIVGLAAHSLAVLSDAGHNVSDALALALAWGATRLAGRKPTKRRTYGLKSASILAAVFNSVTRLHSRHRSRGSIQAGQDAPMTSQKHARRRIPSASPSPRLHATPQSSPIREYRRQNRENTSRSAMFSRVCVSSAKPRTLFPSL